MQNCSQIWFKNLAVHEGNQCKHIGQTNANSFVCKIVLQIDGKD